MTYIRFVNWREYQHYKDRNPPWIKLHFSLISSRAWIKLDDAGKLLAVACMMLASQKDGILECDPEYVRDLARLKQTPDFQKLVDSTLCEFCDELGTPLQKKEENREQTTETYMSVAPASVVLAPASISVIDGFQGTSAQVALHDAELIYHAYPRPVGKKAVLPKIAAACAEFGTAVIMERTKAFALARPDKHDPYTPNTATWFNQQRFNDDPATWVRKAETNHRKILTPEDRGEFPAQDYKAKEL